MPARFQLRELTDKEKDTLSSLSRSRTAPKREVERAQIVMLWLEGERAADIARHLNRNITTIDRTLFNWFRCYIYISKGLLWTFDCNLLPTIITIFVRKIS